MDAVRRLRRHVFAIALVCAAAVNQLKGAPTGGVIEMMWAQWLLSWRYGFFRRGLLGTLFQLAFGSLSLDTQKSIVYGAHIVACVVVIAGVLLWTRRAAEAAREHDPSAAPFVWYACAAVFLGQILPTLFGAVGYLDIFFFLLAAIGTYLAWKDRFVAAALVASSGPFVHDAFVFLWLPLIVCEARNVLSSDDRRRALRSRLPLLLPLALAVVVMGFHSQAAAYRAIDAVNAPHLKAAFFFTVASAVERMVWAFEHHPLQTFLGAFMYLPAAVIALACAATLDSARPRAVRIGTAIAATLGPVAVLAIAWDYSRFLVWATFGAFVATVYAARRPSQRERPTWPVKVSLAALALSAFGGPATFSYVNYTFAEYRTGPSLLRHLPGAVLAYAWVPIYDHDEQRETFDTASECLVERNRLVASAPDCAFDVDPSTEIGSQDLNLRPGNYRFTPDLEPIAQCPNARGELLVEERWLLAPAKPRVAFDVSATRSPMLDFDVTPEDSSMGHLHVEVTASSGCLRVKRLRVALTSAAPAP